MGDLNVRTDPVFGFYVRSRIAQATSFSDHASEDFETKDEAVAAAEKIAQQRPGYEFFVYGPLTKVIAEAPITTEEIN